jgi:23S rRNA U2552 (ribose-2'-O)-methylase RlmE/FtsJ
MEFNKKIIITGGNGRFGSILKNIYRSNRLFYPNKKELNILSTKSVEKYLNKVKTLLRPGGTFVFSFYDIGIRDSLLDFERHYTNERNRKTHALIAGTANIFYNLRIR